ncbi:MAG TPA: helical backbone metal receptor [Chryseolinea sp.]|nr:helical backbone metal receptor [Chryseolinea sp.]HPM31791.1 helical backbone metal receptor [Chryseolinea sp.]
MVRTFVDQLGHSITIPFPPKRIISLVPSQTELFADIGLENEVVGITKFCVHPESWLKTKTIVGGTKNFNFDEIDRLRPDVIFGNKEENFEEGISHLKTKYPVWMSGIISIKDSLHMILSLGEITNKISESNRLVEDIRNGFEKTSKFSGQSFLYLIWRKPWMGTATNTFIHSLLDHLGLQNILDQQSRYPELTEAEIHFLQPDYIFLSSEPYPFREKHIEELQSISPSSKIILVDGEMFSWYGSRMLKAIPYFNSLIERVRYT